MLTTFLQIKIFAHVPVVVTLLATKQSLPVPFGSDCLIESSYRLNSIQKMFNYELLTKLKPKERPENGPFL